MSTPDSTIELHQHKHTHWTQVPLLPEPSFGTEDPSRMARLRTDKICLMNMHNLYSTTDQSLRIRKSIRDGKNPVHIFITRMALIASIVFQFLELKWLPYQSCTVLYYAILQCTILYYNILYYSILYDTILYYTILYYTILYYTILYYTILYYTIL